MSLIKLKNNALDNLTSFEGTASTGDMKLISSATASSSASIEFDLGDKKEYKFFFVNIHPSVNSGRLGFNFSTDNGSNYNVVKTNTNFVAQHRESDATFFGYLTGEDIAQSTADAQLCYAISNDNDGSASAILQLFNPSSNTFVKHFIGMSEQMGGSGGVEYQRINYTAGYANTTSALTNIRFQFDSGNIDDGKILMFGLD